MASWSIIYPGKFVVSKGATDGEYEDGGEGQTYLRKYGKDGPKHKPECTRATLVESSASHTCIQRPKAQGTNLKVVEDFCSFER